MIRVYAAGRLRLHRPEGAPPSWRAFLEAVIAGAVIACAAGAVVLWLMRVID